MAAEGVRLTSENVDIESEGASALESLRNFGYHLATCRPSMAPLARAASGVLAAVHTSLHSRAGPFEITARNLLAIFQEVIRSLQSASA